MSGSAKKMLLEPEIAKGACFLEANDLAYRGVVGRIQQAERQNDPEAALRGVALAAQIAAAYHTGRFADGTIENVALAVGLALENPVVCKSPGTPSMASGLTKLRRVLHVATSVAPAGGHTRMLHQWVRDDRTSMHSLALVNQVQPTVPAWLAAAIRESGGDVVTVAAGLPLCEKALWLREIAKRLADLVVLHHDVCDVIPTVAFAVPDGPPVAVVNVADHQFWLGSSVADVAISLRTPALEYAATRRFLPSGVVLPVPLTDPVALSSRQKARRELGIPADQIVLLSVGRAEKYRPYGAYDFSATATRILDRQGQAHLYVVGESLEGITPYLRSPVHERLHFTGEIEDPSLYHAAADIYMESFPFGSHTALLEAALAGLPTVPAYAPLFPLLVTNDDSVRDLLVNSGSEQEYIQRIEDLIESPAYRVQLGAALRERLLADHVGTGWLTRLAAVYRKTDGLPHNPHPIPASQSENTPEDASLSLWHAMADGRTHAAPSPRDEVARLRHFSAVLKHAGDYSTARRSAWRAVRSSPRQLESWRVLATTLVGSRDGSLRRFLGL